MKRIPILIFLLGLSISVFSEINYAQESRRLHEVAAIKTFTTVYLHIENKDKHISRTIIVGSDSLGPRGNVYIKITKEKVYSDPELGADVLRNDTVEFYTKTNDNEWKDVVEGFEKVQFQTIEETPVQANTSFVELRAKTILRNDSASAIHEYVFKGSLGSYGPQRERVEPLLQAMIRILARTEVQTQGD